MLTQPRQHHDVEPGGRKLEASPNIAVVIPAYRAAASLPAVIAGIGPEVGLIVVVDDACPENTYRSIETAADRRLVLLRHDVNQGVGGAFLTGLAEALRRNALVVVKVDADGQMDTSQIPALVRPIQESRADFVKGNRFYFLSNAHAMPRVRLLGNLALSFLTKLSTGYWDIMDPTNGFFAVHGAVGSLLDHNRISKRFFFESDMLFHLGLLRARVVDLPMRAIYGDEKSNLSIRRIVWPFLKGHLRNTGLRFLYRYFIRDFSLASIELAAGLVLFLFGLTFGVYSWVHSVATGVLASTGTVMLAAVTLLVGFQLLLAFLNYDIQMSPREPLHPLLDPWPVRPSSSAAPSPGDVPSAEGKAP